MIFSPQYFYTGISRVLYALSLLSVLVLVSRIGSEDQIGIYAKYNAILIPLLGFFGMGIRYGIATDNNNIYSFNDVFISRIISIFFISIFFLSLVYFVYDFEYVLFAICILFLRLPRFMSDKSFGYFQKYNLIKHINISLAVRSLFALILIFFGIYYENSIYLTFIFLSFSWALWYIFYDLKINLSLINKNFFNAIKHKKDNIFRSYIKIFNIQLPLSISGFIGNFSNHLPVLLASYLLTPSGLGIFSAAYLLFNSINSIIAEVLVNLLNPLSRIKNLSNIHLKIFISILLILVFINFLIFIIGADIINFIFNNIFDQNLKILIIMSIGFSIKVLNSTLQIFYTSQRKFWNTLTIDLISIFSIFIAIIYLFEDATIINTTISYLYAQLFVLVCILIAFSCKIYKKK